MDFDPVHILVSLIVSAIGFVSFSYGKRMSRIPQLVIGIILMVFPYFVTSVWGVLGITAVLLLGLFGATRAGW